jgi:hypothetical protein
MTAVCAVLVSTVIPERPSPADATLASQSKKPESHGRSLQPFGSRLALRRFFDELSARRRGSRAGTALGGTRLNQPRSHSAGPGEAQR